MGVPQASQREASQGDLSILKGSWFEESNVTIEEVLKYSGTPLIGTPTGPAQVSVLTGCPY